MKHYKIIYPNEHGERIEETLSEQDILDYYWDYWYEQMVRVDKRHLISIKNCIDDWVIVHWAAEVT